MKLFSLFLLYGAKPEKAYSCVGIVLMEKKEEIILRECSLVTKNPLDLILACLILLLSLNQIMFVLR